MQTETQQQTPLQQKLEKMKQQRDTPFYLSDQALTCLAWCLQKAIAEQTSIVEILRNLEFSPRPNQRLYITNPPTMQVMNPELEEKVKNRWIETMKAKSNAETQSPEESNVHR